MSIIALAVVVLLVLAVAAVVVLAGVFLTNRRGPVDDHRPHDG